MALANRLSAECTKSELDLFAAPMTQLSIDQTNNVEINPLNSITDQDVLDFLIPGSGNFYLDLNSTLLYLRLKIVRADGAPLVDADPCGIIQYPLNCIFSQLDVSLNNLISSSSATHPYRSFIETLLNFSTDTLESQFSTGLWYKDGGADLDSVDITPQGPNVGLQKRAAFCRNSREFSLIGPIHADIFFSERMLLNNVDIRLKFVKAKSDFSLMCRNDADYELKILRACLFVKKVDVSPAVSLGHSAALMKANALYPISRVVVKNYTLPAQSRVCPQDNLFLGNLPRYIVLGIVDHTAFVGTRNRNPFRFQHCDLEFLSLSVNGRHIPSKPFQPDFNARQSVREFYNLFLATNRHLRDSALCINREDFENGYSLFALNLSRDDKLDGGALSPVISGMCRLDLRFRAPLPRTMSLIVYACFDTVIEINSKRQVLVDF
ncbi:uncharacterized protein [Paramormyrops kingsleyae]|uniref:uncharacterized protein n=1 Tax=Paramormyrops kingsleyae TaxID=1676925 RepID=UPI003B9799CD